MTTYDQLTELRQRFVGRRLVMPYGVDTVLQIRQGGTLGWLAICRNGGIRRASAELLAEALGANQTEAAAEEPSVIDLGGEA